MFQHRFVTRFVTAVAVVITLGALTSAARAQAFLLVKSDDYLQINYGTADFGSLGHALGAPTGWGFVEWDFSTVNGSLRADASVFGTLFLDSLDPGCARLTIEFKSSAGTILATRTKNVCVTATGHNANDSTNQVDVHEPFGSSNLSQVVLRTHSVVNDHVVSTSPPLISTAPNIKKHDVVVNGNDADFGKGIHAGGGPTGSGLLQLTRDNGNVTGLVSGTLYYDSLFSEGCAQVIIFFEDSGGNTLSSETIKKCGPGGNANDAVNKKNVDETFTSGSLFKIRLRVGQVLPDGSFVRVQTKTCDFHKCV